MPIQRKTYMVARLRIDGKIVDRWRVIEKIGDDPYVFKGRDFCDCQNGHMSAGYAHNCPDAVSTARSELSESQYFALLHDGELLVTVN